VKVTLEENRKNCLANTAQFAALYGEDPEQYPASFRLPPVRVIFLGWSQLLDQHHNLRDLTSDGMKPSMNSEPQSVLSRRGAGPYNRRSPMCYTALQHASCGHSSQVTKTVCASAVYRAH